MLSHSIPVVHARIDIPPDLHTLYIFHAKYFLYQIKLVLGTYWMLKIKGLGPLKEI